MSWQSLVELAAKCRLLLALELAVLSVLIESTLCDVLDTPMTVL